MKEAITRLAIYVIGLTANLLYQAFAKSTEGIGKRPHTIITLIVVALGFAVLSFLWNRVAAPMVGL